MRGDGRTDLGRRAIAPSVQLFVDGDLGVGDLALGIGEC
jgi:hypothetical protein